MSITIRQLLKETGNVCIHNTSGQKVAGFLINGVSRGRRVFTVEGRSKPFRLDEFYIPPQYRYCRDSKSPVCDENGYINWNESSRVTFIPQVHLTTDMVIYFDLADGADPEISTLLPKALPRLEFHRLYRPTWMDRPAPKTERAFSSYVMSAY